jgi:hypothetical protein
MNGKPCVCGDGYASCQIINGECVQCGESDEQFSRCRRCNTLLTEAGGLPGMLCTTCAEDARFELEQEQKLSEGTL